MLADAHHIVARWRRPCPMPSSMEILDVSILAEAFTNLTCSVCNSHLALNEL